MRKRPAILKVKVDTGAQENVLPLRMYTCMYPGNVDAEGHPLPVCLRPNSTLLTAYNGARIPQLGTIRIRCAHSKRVGDLEFLVADTPGPAAMGLPSCRSLELVTMRCEVTREPPNKVIKISSEVTPTGRKGSGSSANTFTTPSILR